MFLEAERVRLRPAEAGDAPRFQGWINEPEIAHLLGGAAFQHSLPAKEEYLRARATNDWDHGVFLSIEATDGESPVLIGAIELRKLHAIARSGEVGMWIGDRAYWDRGFGSEALRTLCRFAFETLDLHRLELGVASYNPRAQRAYMKVGFVIEGRRREDRYVGGRYHDSLVMGLLRREFESRAATRAEP